MAINRAPPLEKEFSGRLAICEALDRDEKGFLLDGKRLPDSKDKDFWPQAQKAHEAFIKRGREGIKDFKALVEAFQSDDNPKWLVLAASTKRGYETPATSSKRFGATIFRAI